MKIELIPIMKIIPYWRNPRRNDNTVDMLCKIIPEYGFNVPLVLDKNYVVVKGHARLRAAKRLGMTEVPCVFSNADPEVIKADRIADNKIQEMSYFDLAKLEMEFQKIGELKFDKLFHPEELKPVEIDYGMAPTYRPVSIDGFDEDDYEYGGYEGNTQDIPRNDSEAPYSDSTAWHGQEQGEGGETAYGRSEGTETPMANAVRRCRTTCPYCGKDTFVYL